MHEKIKRKVIVKTDKPKKESRRKPRKKVEDKERDRSRKKKQMIQNIRGERWKKAARK